MEFNIEQRTELTNILLNMCDTILYTCNNIAHKEEKQEEILNSISDTINEIEKHI